MFNIQQNFLTDGILGRVPAGLHRARVMAKSVNSLIFGCSSESSCSQRKRGSFLTLASFSFLD